MSTRSDVEKEATALAAMLAFAAECAEKIGCPRSQFKIESALLEVLSECDLESRNKLALSVFDASHRQAKGMRDN